MAAETTPDPKAAGGSAAAYYLKLASGPVAFALTMLLPLDLSTQGRIALATFACAAVWWITQPMPWAIAALLPMLVFPATGTMSISATLSLYGHPIFFWIMGTVLMGYAIEKHGLARRFAIGFLAMPGLGGRMRRLTFAYMAVTGLTSMFVTDTAVIAMLMPIGMALVRHIQAPQAAGAAPATNLAAFMTLATFYGALAGGTATMVGIPHNAIAISLLEDFTGRTLGWFDWMVAGVPVYLALLVSFYLLLWIMVPPEVTHAPGGEAFLREERAKLGPVSSNERRVLGVFAVMVLLFTLPTLVSLALGADHRWTAAVQRALPIWVVPPALMVLLFTVPAAGGRADQALLGWKEAERNTPWNVMILVVGAVAMTEALTKFGFVDFMGGIVRELGLGRTALPYVAGILAAVTTNFISGTAATALYCSIFIPASVSADFNPASMAILIANVCLGLALPWAGAAAATTFSVGQIDMGRMIRVGIPATLIFAIITATIHLLMAPFV
ncbi:MAG TPA: SLC13 family permease [Vicinamibacterales bacterium]|nr:SLC13 family permease [Vicinamibacterales bacterium]